LSKVNQKLVDALSSKKTNNFTFTLWPVMWDWFKQTYPGFNSWNKLRLNRSNISNVPNGPGVYFFALEPEIVTDGHLYLMYVGSSGNLRQRFKQYDAGKGSNDEVTVLLSTHKKYLYFTFFTVNDNSQEAKEEALITALHPPLNKRGLKLEAVIQRVQKAF
jgi:hypothetical protein